MSPQSCAHLPEQIAAAVLMDGSGRFVATCLSCTTVVAIEQPKGLNVASKRHLSADARLVIVADYSAYRRQGAH